MGDLEDKEVIEEQLKTPFYLNHNNIMGSILFKGIISQQDLMLFQVVF